MPVELVGHIVENLVTEPDKLRLEVQQEGPVTRIAIRCASQDTGRIIGRGGRVINSIRTLARAAAEGQQRVEVDVIED